MIKGQIMVYRYNGLDNAKPNVDRDIYHLKNIEVDSKQEFQQSIEMALDEVAPGKGYVLVKWNDRLFMCEKDPNNPNLDYVRHELTYHPLLKKFN